MGSYDRRFANADRSLVLQTKSILPMPPLAPCSPLGLIRLPTTNLGMPSWMMITYMMVTRMPKMISTTMTVTGQGHPPLQLHSLPNSVHQHSRRFGKKISKVLPTLVHWDAELTQN